MMLRRRLAAIEETRAKADSLPIGPAPCISSASFKALRRGKEQVAERWNHRLSVESLGRCKSTLKAATSTASPSSMITLGTARPTPEYYPWNSSLIHGAYALPDIHTSKQSEVLISCGKEGDAFDPGVALNYGYAAGSPQLLRFITEHVELIHDPQYQDWETCLTCGTTSAIEIVFRMLCNRGDWIFAEEYTYSGAVDAGKPLGIRFAGLKVDEEGMIPEDLESKLLNWNHTQGPKPFVLYTIPTGQNPTGTTQTAERRRDVYSVAEKHDLLIIEDDPYYFIHFGQNLDKNVSTHRTNTVEEYINSLPPSYLSMDSSGRVIRLDTMSKILAPGLRCGWLTACSQLVEKFLNHTEFSTVAPSGPSQLMAYRLLDEAWGHEGFLRWLSRLSMRYRGRRDIMLEACRRHLPPGICHWQVPGAGMFLWVAVNRRAYPSASCKAPTPFASECRLDIEDQVYWVARENGVQISKGSWFAVSQQLSHEVFFRLTFAAAPEDQLEAAVERFANVLWRIFLSNELIRN